MLWPMPLPQNLSRIPRCVRWCTPLCFDTLFELIVRLPRLLNTSYPEQANHQVAHYSKEWRGLFPLGSFAEMSGEEYSTDNTPSTVSLLIDWHFWLQSSDSDRKWRQEFVCIKHCNPAVSMLFMNNMKPKSLNHISTTWVVEMIIRAKRLTSTSSPTSL